MSIQYQTDVLIVGAGLAGLVTALELLDSNQRILILDRDEPSRLGGLAKESFGGVTMIGTPHQKRTGIHDSPELALADWTHTAGFDPGDDWPRRWAEYYVHHSLQDIYHWLSRRSVKFFPVVHWVERGLYTPGNSVPRFHMVWGAGHGLIDGLLHQLENHPHRSRLEIKFRHAVRSLEAQNGRVTGCQGMDESTHTDFRVLAQNVAAAAGGISGSLQRIRANWYKPWGPPPAKMLNGSHRYADGTLHDAAAATGASVTHLDRQWNYAAGVHHPYPDKPEHGLSLVPPKSALWVDATGRRFGPVPLVTAFDTRFLVEQICLSPHQYSWQILNRKIAVKELAVSGAEFNEAIRDKKSCAFLATVFLGNRSLYKTLTDKCPDFIVADTLETLVEKMNALDPKGPTVSLETLRAAIQQYDGMIDRGPRFFDDDQLRRIAQARQYFGDRARTCKFQKILDPGAAPLVAIREFILTRKSLGGIQTDLQSRALNHQGEAVPGLYAVGEAAGFGGGGIHGLRPLEGTFLGACILTGQAAARSLAGKGGPS
jgi:hypothetical protein